METLEKEKAELKERLMHSSKKVLLEGLTKSTASLTSPVSLLPSTHSLNSTSNFLFIFQWLLKFYPVKTLGNLSTAQSRESPLLITEVSHLRQALRQSQAENAQLSAQKLQSKLDCLPHLEFSSRKEKMQSSEDNKLKELMRKAQDLKWVSNRCYCTVKYLTVTYVSLVVYRPCYVRAVRASYPIRPRNPLTKFQI